MQNGLKQKYIVISTETGKAINDCFVLRPERDQAAVAAIQAYAEATDNTALAEDLTRWVGTRYNHPLTLDELGEIVDSDFGAGHIWIWDMNAKFSMPAIVDLHYESGICGVYGAGDVDYTEEDYGKTWLAYLRRPQ